MIEKVIAITISATLPYSGVSKTFYDLRTNPIVTDSQEEPFIIEETQTGYIATTLNVRASPGLDGDVIGTLYFNDPVDYAYIDNTQEWAAIYYDDSVAFICTDYISDHKKNYKIYSVPSYRGFKSYMPWTSITSKSSPQYKLQHQYAYTGEYGIRQVNDRFCAALGSYFDCKVGQYFDLVLENGVVIPCIMADEKADCDTDGDNLFTVSCGCMSEFVVSSDLNSRAKQMGDISYCCKEWRSPVAEVWVYDTNVLRGDE